MTARPIPDKSDPAYMISSVGEDRKSLKYHFREGARPLSKDFATLIDSMVNKHDDGFRKDSKNGLTISSAEGNSALLSFARGLSGDPSWKIAFTKEKEQSIGVNYLAQLGDKNDIPIITIDATKGSKRGRHLEPGIGINRDTAEYALDVNGAVRTQGRYGTEPGEPILANGKWHAITEDLYGCNVLEVVAGVGGGPQQGRYALIRAIVINAYGPRRGWFREWLYRWLISDPTIRCQSTVYQNRTDRLELRWARVKDSTKQSHAARGDARSDKDHSADEKNWVRPYRLEIRTRSSYGENPKSKDDSKNYKIQCHLTQLWGDPFMSGSRK